MVGMRLAGERVVLVADPAVAADVMIGRAELFVKKGTAFFPGSSLAGNGLLVSDGEAWLRQRQGLTLVHLSAQIEPFSSPALHKNTHSIPLKCSR